MVANAPTEEEKDTEWANFQAEYSENIWQEVISYITTEWMNEDIAKKFLKCYIDEFLHLGQRVTSRGEGGHSMIKKNLRYQQMTSS